MSVTKRLLSCGLLAVLTGCISPLIDHHLDEFVGQSDYQLAEFTHGDGTTEVFELSVRPLGKSGVRIRKTAPRRFASLGVEVAPSQTGLLVKKVKEGSGAAQAGIAADDIIQGLDGSAVKSVARFHELMDAVQERGDVLVQLRGEAKPRRVTPTTEVREAQTRKFVELQGPSRRNPKPFAGMRVGAIPSEVSRRIFGDDRHALVVEGVVRGSPAYLAGLRGGDLIERVNGRRPPSLDELFRVLREEGPAGGTIEFDVSRDRRAGFHAVVRLADYSDSTRVHLPGVFLVRDDVRESRWQIAPWGMLVRYENAFAPSNSRDVKERGAFSMLLGLFRHSWRPGGSRTRLLWFISFGD